MSEPIDSAMLGAWEICDMLNQDLIAAYKFARQLLPNATRPRKASDCLAIARADVAANKKRYPASGFAAITKQLPVDGLPSAEPGLYFVEKPENFGLRYVGRVEPESYKFTQRDSTGWLTEPGGETYRDGSGLMWGVVYQLPGRHGCARFVAGYVMGGDSDNGATLDLSRIEESSPQQGDPYDNDPKDRDAAKEAACSADNLARIAAEHEREYQTAWRAGSDYAQTREEIGENRGRVLAQIQTVRILRNSHSEESAALKNADSVLSELLESRAKLFAEIEQLAAGTWQTRSGHYPLYFDNNDQTLRASFNEGAGRTILKTKRI